MLRATFSDSDIKIDIFSFFQRESHRVIIHDK